MVAEEAKYTEAQLETLVADGIARETAGLTSANDELQGQVDTLSGEKAELETKVTELEAEVATERTAKEAAEQQLSDFQAAQEAEAEKARLSTERTNAFKEAAGSLFPEDYYTEERIASWIGMPEEAFAAVLETVAASAEQAGKKGGEPGKSETAGEAERETAAFGGGGKPTSKTGADGQSTTRQFLSASGRIPTGV